MGYHVRAFCKGAATPSLAVIQVWLNERVAGTRFTSTDHDGKQSSGRELSPAELHATDWTQVELVYKSGKLPIIAECNREGDPDSLVRAEAEEFRELIGEAGRSTVKRQVLAHLAATKFIVACQLLSDLDDDGYEANYQFLSYSVEHCDGIIHADGEGFYAGDRLIVEVG